MISNERVMGSGEVFVNKMFDDIHWWLVIDLDFCMLFLEKYDGNKIMKAHISVTFNSGPAWLGNLVGNIPVLMSRAK